MANDNETVEQVALSDCPLAEQIRIIRDNYSIGSGEFDALDEAADVIECQQREIAGLKGERAGILKANESLASDNTRLRDEMAAKDAEIERLRAALKTCVDYVKCEYGCGSECDAACEEIESGCKLREWTIEFGLETLDRKGGE